MLVESAFFRACHPDNTPLILCLFVMLLDVPSKSHYSEILSDIAQAHNPISEALLGSFGSHFFLILSKRNVRDY